MLESKFSKISQIKFHLLQVAEQESTPAYIYDPAELKNNLQLFKNAFNEQGVEAKIFYAIKSNYYAQLLKDVVEFGEGLDASSQRELKLALEAGAKKIIYTGPAKEEKDFELILEHTEKVSVNLESFRELKLLGEMAEKSGKVVRCALRVTTSSQKGWTKFGLPLERFKDFYLETLNYPALNFCGLHFHISMNKTPDKYVSTLNEIAAYFKQNFTPQELQKFEYIDMGGGIYPQPFEGIYSWNPDQVMQFFSNETHFEDIIADKWQPRYLPLEVEPIEKFAEAICGTWLKTIKPILPNAELYCEPGRFICHSAMHILLKLVEIKNENMGITDGGNNIVGWEKHQFFNYTPLFNLSQFDLENERPFVSYGSLCTPDDIWGYYLYTKGQPKPGDIILMPFQGAYTYTLAQEFIKDIPKVVNLSADQVS